MKTKFAKSFVSRQLGQGMTEYIIITALVAIAAIGAFMFFGQTARHQVAGMAMELSGQDGGAERGLAQTQGAAGTVQQANKASGLGQYGGNAQQ